VNSFVAKMAVENEAHAEVAVAHMKSSFDVLLTCAEDNPLVRYALEVFGQAGKPAWIFPEGAVPLNEQFWPFYRMFHYSPQGTNRVVFCEVEREFWLRQEPAKGSPVTIGYLADPTAATPMEDLVVRSWWALHRRLDPVARRRSPVLLSYEVLEDFGMTRLGLPSESEMLRAMDQAVLALTNAGHYVLVKARSDLVAGIASERYRHLPVFVTSKLPWQSLARLAGGVVARESSLVFEAQCLGLRAVVWNPTHLISRAEALANEFPNDVKVAYTDSELVDATKEMPAPLWSRRIQKRVRDEMRERIWKWALQLGEPN